MTLKEKFKEIIFNYDYTPNTMAQSSNQCEKIADEFAIGFAEWLGKGMTARLNNGNWIYNMELKASTTQELLETYKKEKGL